MKSVKATCISTQRWDTKHSSASNDTVGVDKTVVCTTHNETTTTTTAKKIPKIIIVA